MKHAAATALLVLALGGSGCGPQIEEVKVSLRAGHCAGGTGSGLERIKGVWGALSRRGAAMLLWDCVDTHGGYDSVDQLYAKLAQMSPFEHVPETGLWDFWVVGTDRECCESQVGAQVRLCGVRREFTLPLADGKLTVEVHCLPLVYEEKDPAAVAVKSCVVGQPTLSPRMPCGL